MLDPNAIARELVILIEDLVQDCEGWELTSGEVVVSLDEVEEGEQQFTIHTERTPFEPEGRTFIIRVEELKQD